MITAHETLARSSLAVGFGWPASAGRLAAPLTRAELRVLVLIREGLSNKEISTLLGRAEPTIKHQVSACLKKFGVPSRSRLIAVAR